MPTNIPELTRPLPEGAERIYSSRELIQRMGIDGETTADFLGLQGPLRENFIGNYARNRNLDTSARWLPLMQYTGSSPRRPFLLLNQDNNTNVGKRRQFAEQAGQVRFRVRPEAIQSELIPGLFPAWFIDLPKMYSGMEYFGAEDHLFQMRLPDDDFEKIQRHLQPAREILIPESFGCIAYRIRDEGALEIISLENELFDRLNDKTLRQRYANWRSQLLCAFTYYVQVRPLHVKEQNDSWLLKSVTPKLIIVSDSIIDLSKATSEAKSATGRLRALHTGIPAKSEEKIDEEVSQVMDTLTKVLDFRSRTIWCRPKTPDGKIAEPPHKFVAPVSVFSRAVMPVQSDTFLNSDMFLPQLFESIEVTDIRNAYARVDELFPQDIFEVAVDHGYLTALPLRPALFFSDQAQELRRSFEIAAADPLNCDQLLVNLERDELECLQRARESFQGRFAAELLGDYFSMISKARISGRASDWWRIPENVQGIHLSATHVSEQNRHPCVRCVVPDASGKLQKFVIGFKGGGARELLDDAEFEVKPEDLELPIYYNSKPNQKVDDDPNLGAPAPMPDIYGGSGMGGGIRELTLTTSIRNFVEKHAPDLIEVLPLPLDVRRYLSIPVWRDGKTEWIPAREYGQRFLGGTYDEPVKLSSYISVQACDVRLRQLVGRIFNRTPESACDLQIAAHEIQSSFQALMWWNNEDTQVRALPQIAKARNLSLADMLKIFAKENAQDSGRAERVFLRTAGRLSEFVGFIHGAGGHFGGGWRKVEGAGTMGICYGGPLGMRNIDLTGGLHDFDMDTMFFPWSKWRDTNWNTVANNYTEMERTLAFDRMYLAEAVHWFDMILNGRARPRLGVPSSIPLRVNQFNDVLVLNERSSNAPTLTGLVNSLKEDNRPRALKISKLLGSQAAAFYMRGFERGVLTRSES